MPTASAAPAHQSATGVHLRPATPDDTAELKAVFARAFPPLERLLFSTTGHTIVAIAGDGTLVGGTVLRALDIGGSRVGVVDWVFADPDAQIPGVGSALRDAAQRWFDEAGCDEQVARIEPVNTASQELHRGGGYVPLPFRSQVRRWGWRLPQLWLRIHAGFDPGLRLWARPGSEAARPHLASRLAGTVALNALLIALVVWRSPRDLAVDPAGIAWALAIAGVLLGVRETVLRVTARTQGLRLHHVPWTSGVGVAVPLAVAFGVWFPLTGSSVPDRPGWRYDRELPRLATAHLAAGIAVAAMAWSTVLVDSGPAWLPLAEVRRAAVMLALLDLVVPVSPMLGTTARIVCDRSKLAWGALAVAGVVPFLLTLGGR